MSTQEIPESLFEDGWLDGIEHVISSGKEGTVWCCSCAESSRIDSDYVAVKVYRPRSTRSFKNDSIYVQGRSFGVALSGATGIARSAGAPDQRLNRAIKNRSRIGKMASEDSWTHHEFATLTSLYQAGAHVPRPYTSTNRAIVMEYLGEPDAPAPKLKEVELGIDEAYAVFRLLIEEIELWLSYERIHGDLSPFNILYWREKVTVIDFPQAINPYENPLAYTLLERDVHNICKYFAHLSQARDPSLIARTLWQRAVQLPF